MAIHGLWGNAYFWNPLKSQLPEAEFSSPKIDWSKFQFEEFKKEFELFRPDVLIGHGYGAYIAQKLLEGNLAVVKACVLIAPIGPKGFDFKSLFYLIKEMPGKFIKGLLKGEFQISDRQLRFKLMGIPKSDFERYGPFVKQEKLKSIVKCFLNFKSIKTPASIPILVVNGDKDKFISQKAIKKTVNFYQADQFNYPELGHDLLVDQEVAIKIQKWIKKTTGE